MYSYTNKTVKKLKKLYFEFGETRIETYFIQAQLEKIMICLKEMFDLRTHDRTTHEPIVSE